MEYLNLLFAFERGRVVTCSQIKKIFTINVSNGGHFILQDKSLYRTWYVGL